MAAFAFAAGTAAQHRYFVLLHTAEPPEAEIWQAYVEAVAATLARTEERVHAFVVTDGGGPDASQRKKLADAFARGDAMTHVFTTNVFVRGIVTAFRWIAQARATAYAPAELAVTCTACGVPARDVIADLVKLQGTMPTVRALELVQGGSARKSGRPNARSSDRP
jgi:hypothetical protein